MAWQRLGRVFRPSGELAWSRTHAANPFALQLAGSRYRVFFSTRDALSRSSVGYVDLHLETRRVLSQASEPILSFGDRGTFDERGVSVGCVVDSGHGLYMYYMGWNLSDSVPFRNSIGLAIRRAGERFERYSEGPILDRNPHDPFSLSYPCVLKQGSVWKMWYGSHLRWASGRRDMEHVIKYAESEDGICWHPTGQICIDVESDESFAYSRPSVLCEDGRYKMWFSFRGQRYRIGYAESADGVHWRRMDERGGLDPQGKGWESESVEYAHVFDHDGRRYAIYCGNGYGMTGFGLAVQQADR